VPRAFVSWTALSLEHGCLQTLTLRTQAKVCRCEALLFRRVWERWKLNYCRAKMQPFCKKCAFGVAHRGAKDPHEMSPARMQEDPIPAQEPGPTILVASCSSHLDLLQYLPEKQNTLLQTRLSNFSPFLPCTIHTTRTFGIRDETHKAYSYNSTLQLARTVLISHITHRLQRERHPVPRHVPPCHYMPLG
jgi:hypothetical protein